MLDLMKQWLLYLTIHFLIICQLRSLLFSELSLDLNKQVLLKTGNFKQENRNCKQWW